MVTYTSEQHLALATFANWRKTVCHGLHILDHRPMEWVCTLCHWRGPMNGTTFHNAPPPALDDTLADVCLDELKAVGEEPQLTGLIRGWRCEIIHVSTEILWPSRREAIFAVTLNYLTMQKEPTIS